MSKISYLIFAEIMRVLAAMGSLWYVVLLCAVAAWSSSHVVLFWSLFWLAVTGAISLLCGVATVTSRRAVFLWITLYGASIVLIAGISTFVTGINDKTQGATLLFVLIYFLLTITAPLFVVAMCSYDLFQRKGGDPKAAALSSAD